ncbi:MAG: MFS transporter, partial [Actinomycetota bacterium]
MTFTSPSKLPRSIRWIASARAISLLGDEIALLALLFRAKGELGHWGVAAMLIAGTAPLVLVGPFAGLLVDRVRVRPLLIATLTAQAIICVALALSSGVALLALIGLLATATSVVTPALQVLIPTLVSDEELPRAMGLSQSLFALAGVAGPFLGGILFATFGFNSVVLVDASTFIVIAGVILALRVDRAPQSAPGEKATSDNWRSGLLIIGREPLLRSLAVLLVMVVLTFGVVNVVEIFYTTVVLHAGPRAYGLLGLCMGAGMLVASSLTGKLTSRFVRAERVFLFACASLIALLFAFSKVRSVWQAAIVLFVVGLANAVL